MVSSDPIACAANGVKITSRPARYSQNPTSWTGTQNAINSTVTGPRPDVIVDFLFEDGLLFVAVTNIGPEPAQRVHVDFDPPFQGLGGTACIPGLPLFRNIEFLAPHRSIRTLVDSSAAYFARHEPERITAAIAYSDRAGNDFSCTILHDLAIYRDLAFVPKPERSSPPHGHSS